MKNKFLAIICTLAVCFSFAANLNVFCAENINDIIISEHLTKENFLSLPSEKLVEDFEYYFKTMKENSPFFNATKRHIPDLEKQFEEYKKKISESNSNFEQLHLIDEFANKFLGHNGVIWDNCSYMANFFENMMLNRKTWSKALEKDPLTQRNTDLYNYFRWNEAIQFRDLESEGTTENVETRIIEPNKIAYMKVKSFSTCNIGPHDEKIISDFFEETKNCDNIIIDITGNGGGSSSYVNYFAPLLKHNFEISSYALFKMGDNEGYFNEIQPIDKLPEFKNLNLEDKKELTHFAKRVQLILTANNPIKGKVWLLIDNRVFSASEIFTILCKSSKEVTLVGKATAGDGIGIDPIYIILPNSKVTIRYSITYGLNEDGSCNAECGTKPDIMSPDGEDPLTTCLKAIRKQSDT